MLVGAHPDDEVYGSGALALYAEQGLPATIVLMTRGGMGHMRMEPEQLKARRTLEAEQAARCLGADLVFLEYEDSAVPHCREAALQLVDIFRRYRPDVVLTLPGDDKHPDHRNTHYDVVDAYYLASLPLLKREQPHHYIKQVYVFGGKEPHVYLDISSVIEKKIEAARCHRSQFEEWLVEHRGGVDRSAARDFLRLLRERARQAGFACGVEYAESFTALFPPTPPALTRFPAS